ncbi:MAG: gamma carbonic anhydrase family protein [Silvanigrellales bacterium]|jgi:carbonic anhydrase/acetyltransferase-like protein (isoleucine patch superfamily)|nr:gamma carbonic anhydrase family protein [Silvanigrellales bacterium]
MDFLLGRVPHRSALASVVSFQGLWPRLAANVFLADGARVVGDVEMGEHSSVWFNAVVRGDVDAVRIGARTNIQDGAVVHCTYKRFSTTIGNDVSIAHLAMIHGCVIEDECLVGMQAILMDGVVVGKGSIIGAGAVVTQGTKIPPGSLVLGAPGKVVRPVTPEELVGVLDTTRRYLQYAQGYVFTGGRSHGN